MTSEEMTRIVHNVVLTELAERAFAQGVGSPLTLEGAKEVAEACAARVVPLLRNNADPAMAQVLDEQDDDS